MAITCRTCGEETRAWWMAQCPRCIANERSVLTSELAAAKEEIEGLKELYKTWGFANAPCPAHSKPSLLTEDCAVCRAEAAEAALASERKETERLRVLMPHIYKAIEVLGAGPELLAIIGSYGDTLSTEDIIECIEQFNEKGSCVERMIAKVGDTPSDRRSRFVVIKASLHPPQQEEQ